MKALELVPGTKYGRLTLMSEAEPRYVFDSNRDKNSPRRQVLVKCDCGVGPYILPLKNLASDNTRSCGCYGKERRIESRLIENRETPAYRMLLGSYKRHAHNKGIPWTISEWEFQILTKSPCFYTGREPSRTFKSSAGSTYLYNGIDRLDNNKGYIIENCVPCCAEINYAKRGLSLNEFLDLVGEIGVPYSFPKFVSTEICLRKPF